MDLFKGSYRQGSLDALASLLEALETATKAGLVQDLAGAVALVKASIAYIELTD